MRTQMLMLYSTSILPLSSKCCNNSFSNNIVCIILLALSWLSPVSVHALIGPSIVNNPQAMAAMRQQQQQLLHQQQARQLMAQQAFQANMQGGVPMNMAQFSQLNPQQIHQLRRGMGGPVSNIDTQPKLPPRTFPANRSGTTSSGSGDYGSAACASTTTAATSTAAAPTAAAPTTAGCSRPANARRT